jgi:phospholipid transport system transporter-binding protein
MSINIIKTKQGIQLKGDIGMLHSAQLLPATKHLMADIPFEIDFSEVTHVDTTTVSLMFEWMRFASTVGCALKFHHLPKNLISLMALYGVDEMLPH